MAAEWDANQQSFARAGDRPVAVLGLLGFGAPNLPFNVLEFSDWRNQFAGVTGWALPEQFSLQYQAKKQQDSQRLQNAQQRLNGEDHYRLYA